MFVMMSAVAINVITFNYTLLKLSKPLLTPPGSTFSVPPKGKVDLKLIGGAAIFGLGWGLSGLCPGPGLLVFFSMTHAILFVASLIIG